MQVVLGKRGDYAIRAVLDVAERPHTRRKAREIAERNSIPHRFLSRILADLVRARILHATAGPSGGYELVEPADQLSLLRVIEAIDGPAADRECLLHSTPCNSDNPCAIHHVWIGAEEAMLERLRGTTFAEIAADGGALSTSSQLAARLTRRG